MERVKCPVCDNEGDVLITPDQLSQELLFVQDFYRKRLQTVVNDLTDQADFVQRDITGINSCDNCSTIFRNPSPSPDEILERYKNERYSTEKLDFFFNTYTPHFLKRLNSIRQWLPTNPRILEVGAYAGGFMNACKIQGIKDIEGIDVCEDINIFLEEKGFKISSEPIFEYSNQQTPSTFDCVAIWNCFDQLPFPMQDIISAENLLKKNGILVLRFPNGEIYRKIHSFDKKQSARDQILKVLMCYNNLYGFTFRNGYSINSITELIKNTSFNIVDAKGSQLISINNQSEFKSWARIEEGLTRRLTDRIFSNNQLTNFSPWLEIILKKT